MQRLPRMEKRRRAFSLAQWRPCFLSFGDACRSSARKQALPFKPR